jgi:hypothetical protein
MFGGRSLETEEEAASNAIMRWGGVAGEAWAVLPATGTPPRKAWGAAMAVHPSQPRLFVFGGTNLKSAFNQLHVLDLEQLRWSELWSEGSGGCLLAQRWATRAWCYGPRGTSKLPRDRAKAHWKIRLSSTCLELPTAFLFTC